MANARLYIKGEGLDFAGSVKDKFRATINETQTARSGVNYPKTVVATKTLSIDDVLTTRKGFIKLVAFLNDCDNQKFPVTVAFDVACGTGEEPSEFIYTGCTLEGEPEYDMFENKITGFVFAYEERQVVA